MKPKSESVKVAVRVRPMNSREKEENSTICVEVDPSTNQISVSNPKQETKTFQFDYVYPLTSSQREVYDEVAFPIVESIFQGYNGTIFAYGQTGCGKTYTMMGIVNDSTLKGVIPNAFDHIFGYIANEGTSKRFLVRCSFVEIYNEEVRDLLVKSNSNNNGIQGKSNKGLEVREDPKKGTYVKGLSYTPLKSSDEIIKCLDKGNANRHVGVTSMNDKSSRSHSLFTVYLEIEDGDSGDNGDSNNKKIKTAKLNLVDLAGSERVSKTKATGQTFDEGKKINLSLTALGSVIDALSSNRKHIPYKDSKLTRLLADSLGGNTKTVMFANISPASFNYEETVGTLRYASRAKLIKNAPKVNEDPKDALLRQYEEQIKLLKEQLNNNNNNNSSPQVIEKIIEVKGNDEGIMDQEERRMLLEKIAMLEKGVIDNNNVNSGNKGGNNGSSNDGSSVVKKNKFKEYRKKQLEHVELMERKLEQLREEKQKEEENLLNDVNKLRQRVKELENEIEDLKYDNAKDRTTFFENIKGLNKDNALYKGILNFILSEIEMLKIIEKCRYNENNETWKIPPFYFRNKTLSFPNIKGGQIADMIENEYNTRDVIIDNDNESEQQQQQPQFSFDNNHINNNKHNITRLKITSIPKPSNKINNDENEYDNSNSNSNNNEKRRLHRNSNAQSCTNILHGNGNYNMFIINRKEKERYEMLSKGIIGNNNNNKSVSSNHNDNVYDGNSNNNMNVYSGSKYYGNNGSSNVFSQFKRTGKFILDPLGRKTSKIPSMVNNNNKYEISYKSVYDVRDSENNIDGRGSRSNFNQQLPNLGMFVGGKRLKLLGNVNDDNSSNNNNYYNNESQEIHEEDYNDYL